MSRLIDADELIKAIKNHKTNVASESGFANEIYSLAHEHIIDVITIQPTAFDTEKVVEQLMIIHDEGYCPSEDSLECVLNKACSDCYREKIADIVKKGGVE